MNITFRWFGRDNDTVDLQDVKQIPGVKGIVWGLHQHPLGKIWPEEKINSEVKYIESHGFHAEVVESVNVHESIKKGSNDRDLYIDNYKQTIRNLAKYGVKVICYNFMPVFDWLRTNMKEPLPDGSTALFYEKKIGEGTNLKEISERVLNSTDLTLPGWEPEKFSELEELLQAYEGVSQENLWDNLSYFLNSVLPVAENNDVKLAIHPDDPPFPVFGLPRIIKDDDDLNKLFSLSDSLSHCLTFCTGALGANQNNNVVNSIKKFSNKSPFLHIRNVKNFDNGDFIETSHLTSDGSLDIKGVVEHLSNINYQGYIRPDHGRHIWNENSRPGYGLYDRALGIMYLNGLWDAYHSMK